MLRIVLLLALVVFQSSCFEQVVQQTDMSSKQSDPALPTNHPPVNSPDSAPTTAAKPSILANGSMVMGSRFFVASVLRNTFTSSSFTASQTATFNTIIDEGIFRYPNIFGGAANLYSTRGLKEMTDASCGLSCNNESYQELPLNMPSTPARSVLLGKTCARILDNSVFLTAGLEKIGVTVPMSLDVQEFDNSKIASIYELFYLSSADSAILDAVAAGVASAKTKGFSKIDQWRFAYLMICESGHWQML